MIRNTRVQMLAVLVVGSLLGYLAASSQFSSRHAEASPTTPLAVEKPITPPAGKPACCEIIEGDLIAQATATAAAQTGAFGGKVQSANRPISGSTVTLYAASEGEPVQLAQGMTGEDGTFKLDVGAEKLKGAVDKVLYVVARGGTPKAGKGPNDAAALMALLGTILPETVTINELTTVASTFTAARFINGESVSGKPLGLRIAAGNVPNLVDPATGGWGKVLLDPLNCTQTTTLANLNTLGSLLSAFFTVADDAWCARFLKAATPVGTPVAKNTLEAMAGIARTPGPTRRRSTRYSTKPIRSRRTAPDARRLSCRILP